LKHVATVWHPLLHPVAPFTGAWIETLGSVGGSLELHVAPFTGAWIETRKPSGANAGLLRRPLHGGVD